jgi:hypothetical protein
MAKSNRLPRGVSPAACTIVSRNYLSFARILAKSYNQHEPTGRFYLLVIDGLPDGVDAGADVHLLGPEDIGVSPFDALTFAYDVAELCTAVKPTLLLKLFNDFGERQALFLDPDILVMRPMEELKQALAASNIVFTPNLLEPVPFDGLRPTDQDIFLSGTFNLGFIGVSNSSETLDFLSWWEDHLLNGEALVSVPKGMMTDQKWMDLVPSYFDGTTIFRDDTYNVAWWNLHHRAVTKEGGRYLANGRPISFFHFSGFDPSNPLGFTKENQTRTRVVAGSALGDLLELYGRLHVENGFSETRNWQCSYACFDDGMFISLPFRRLYLELSDEERARFGNPFRTKGRGTFRGWATAPRPERAMLTPFLESLYAIRFDMWPSYPDIVHNEDDRNGFLAWARADGGRELKYDADRLGIGEAVPAM